MANAFGPKNLPTTQKGKATKEKNAPEVDASVGAVKGKGAAPAPKFYRPSAKKK